MRRDMDLERLQARAARALYNEGEARRGLERTLERIGSDRPGPREDSDDYDPPPVSLALHG